MRNLRPSLAGFAALAGAALVVAFSAPVSPQQPGAGANVASRSHRGGQRVTGECRRVFLTQRPGWSTSAVWKDDELLVVDQVYNKVLRYSSTGQSLGTMPDAVETSLESFFPISVRARDSGLLFQLTTRQVAAVDKNYLPLARTDFQTDVPHSNNAQSLWQWEPSGEDIISFSDINSGDINNASDWKAAYLRFRFDDPSRVTILQEFPYDHPLRLYNRVAGPYIAVLQGTVYILRVDEGRIYTMEGDSLQPTPIVLPEVSSAPTLPRFYTKEDVVPVAAAIEGSTMAMSLFGWKDRLYVVIRAFNGTTQWKIVTIDPGSFEVLGTTTVPTPANHLLVAPGPSQWAFIEKGPVKGWGDQDIDSVFFVPAEKFTKNLSGDICN